MTLVAVADIFAIGRVMLAFFSDIALQNRKEFQTDDRNSQKQAQKAFGLRAERAWCAEHSLCGQTLYSLWQVAVKAKGWKT